MSRTAAQIAAFDGVAIVPTAGQIDRMIERRQNALAWIALFDIDRECSHGACPGDEVKPESCDCWAAPR